jgi:hypothetical protein
MATSCATEDAEAVSKLDVIRKHAPCNVDLLAFHKAPHMLLIGCDAYIKESTRSLVGTEMDRMLSYECVVAISHRRASHQTRIKLNSHQVAQRHCSSILVRFWCPLFTCCRFPWCCILLFIK